jgi:hypothetical protein
MLNKFCCLYSEATKLTKKLIFCQVDRIYLLIGRKLVIFIAASLVLSLYSLQISSVQAQEETESSGDLTAPEEGLPYGGDDVGTYSIGQDRYGLRIQVDMTNSPSSGNLFVAWLVDNSTDNDIGIGQLVDNELAVTQQITNSSLYNLIEVTEESAQNVGTSRNQSAVVAGAEL